MLSNKAREASKNTKTKTPSKAIIPMITENLWASWHSQEVRRPRRSRAPKRGRSPQRLGSAGSFPAGAPVQIRQMPASRYHRDNRPNGRMTQASTG
jgi:hypothetical protein